METSAEILGKRLLLVGGGHAHVLVLEAFARNPEPGLTITLVTKDGLTPYSGMLPGHLAGTYTRDEIHIDLKRLVRAAGAELILDEAVGFDRAARRVRLKGGEELAYDILSVDIGITPDLSGIAGAEEHALAVKPIGSLLEKWDRLVDSALAPDGPRRFAIVGGGVAGICLAFAVRAFFAARVTDPITVSLIGASEAPSINAGMRRRIARALKRRGIAVHAEDVAVRIDRSGVTLASGRHVPADAVLVSTHAAPPSVLATTDWAKDDSGFLAVRPTLQILNDETAFAVGDCATMVAHPRPKAGVFAVRQGPVLARNLRRAVRGEALEAYIPQRDHLLLIATGDGRAIGGRGRFLAFEGRLAWRLKDFIDRRFMRRFEF
ncbi:FAD-dependent oxidoreductase [Microvirga terrestris]|uniref:FAD-dependent oxidoreductase n=1 Tax=Microvirga terrestris TaxID=2791024 RepID=A0ABS0HS47_9HYPH|nr:FAD-dependent oxidoreductase [Microvirga terrestris]MBF9196294.1 FAD-dependent oxidoreductase [Microvirga terrestris]